MNNNKVVGNNRNLNEEENFVVVKLLDGEYSVDHHRFVNVRFTWIENNLVSYSEIVHENEDEKNLVKHFLKTKVETAPPGWRKYTFQLLNVYKHYGTALNFVSHYRPLEELGEVKAKSRKNVTIYSSSSSKQVDQVKLQAQAQTQLESALQSISHVPFSQEQIADDNPTMLAKASSTPHDTLILTSPQFNEQVPIINRVQDSSLDDLGTLPNQEDLLNGFIDDTSGIDALTQQGSVVHEENLVDPVYLVTKDDLEGLKQFVNHKFECLESLITEKYNMLLNSMEKNQSLAKNVADVDKRTMEIETTLRNIVRSNSELQKSVKVFMQETLVKPNEMTTLVTDNRALAENEDVISFSKFIELHNLNLSWVTTAEFKAFNNQLKDRKLRSDLSQHYISTISSQVDIKLSLTTSFKSFFDKAVLKGIVSQKPTAHKIVLKTTEFYNVLYGALLNVFRGRGGIDEKKLLSTIGEIINSSHSWKSSRRLNDECLDLK